MDYLVWVFLIAISFCGLGAWIAGQKGRSPVEGAILGFLFGPLGAIIAVCLPTQKRPMRKESGAISYRGSVWMGDMPTAAEEARNAELRHEQKREQIRKNLEEDQALEYLEGGEAK